MENAESGLFMVMELIGGSMKMDVMMLALSVHVGMVMGLEPTRPVGKCQTRPDEDQSHRESCPVVREVRSQQTSHQQNHQTQDQHDDTVRQTPISARGSASRRQQNGAGSQRMKMVRQSQDMQRSRDKACQDREHQDGDGSRPGNREASLGI